MLNVLVPSPSIQGKGCWLYAFVARASRPRRDRLCPRARAGETPGPRIYPPPCGVRGGGLTTAMGKRVKTTRAAAGSSTFTCTV